MSRVLAAIVFCSVHGARLHAGGAGGGVVCAPENGDVNGDSQIDLGDAITILGHLFLGGPTSLLPPCSPPAAAPALPATGQSKCYEADGREVACDVSTCPGQDGAYAPGCPPEGRFVDAGDGTVLDICTGLVWQKEAEPERLLWCDALLHCEGMSLAGHDDWRLPNVRELQSLVDYGRSGLALDPVFVPADLVWSSTPAGGDHAWFVGFGVGNLGGSVSPLATTLGNRAQARAVRSGDGGAGGACATGTGDVNGDSTIDLGDAITLLGHLFLGGPTRLLPFCASPAPVPGLPATGEKTCYDRDGAETACNNAACPGQDGAYSTGCPPQGRFADGGDGTVLDTCTGLVWQKRPGAENRTWCDALAYCEGLNFAGHDDWRLPNVRELLSIVDYGRTGTSLDPVFSHSGYPVYWSSTPQTNDARQAWTVGFPPGNGGGTIGPVLRTNDRLTVRAVRTGP